MIGLLLGNRYEIIKLIGSGGMSLVYKAKCTYLNRFVAIKVLKKEVLDDTEIVNRFKAEAQALGRFTHQNIVSIYDVGKHNGMSYIVMEYVEGITLKEHIAKGPIPASVATNFSIQICNGLMHAHKNHVIHRDIKPHNIMLTNEGTIKVTDFGIAHAVTTNTIQNKATTTCGDKSAIGSVHYFSPEQAYGKATDERSDIYSLGIVIYEMLTGSVPYNGDTIVAIAMKHLSDPVPILTKRHPAIPPALEGIIIKCMSKQPENRFKSVEELLGYLYRAYDNPDKNIVYESEFLPPNAGNIRNTGEDTQRDNKEKNTKNNKSPMKSVILAACSVILIMVISGFVGYSFLLPKDSSKEVPVPNLLGLKYEDIKDEYNGFEISIKDKVESDKYNEGLIISQDPAYPTSVLTPKTIEVVVSLGKKAYAMEDFKFRDLREVELTLNHENIKFNVIEENHPTISKGLVISHTPGVDAEISENQTVTIYVSKGKVIEKVTVPSLVGDLESEAVIRIHHNNLLVGKTTKKNSDKPKNTIISQNPSAGSVVDEKTSIDIEISDGPLEESPESSPSQTTEPKAPTSTGSSQTTFNSTSPSPKPSTPVAKTEHITVTVPESQVSTAAEVRITVNDVQVYNKMLQRGQTIEVPIQYTEKSVVKTYIDSQVHSIVLEY